MDEKEVSEMQEEMMTVLVVEPMKAPYVKSIPNGLSLEAVCWLPMQTQNLF